MSKPITAGARTLVAKTCNNCLELRLGSQFQRASRGKGDGLFYNSWCRICTSKESSKGNHRRNNETLETATKNNELWTGAEVERLEKMTQAGWKAKDIAVAMNRSVWSIYKMRSRLNKEKDDG